LSETWEKKRYVVVVVVVVVVVDECIFSRYIKEEGMT